jgi:hypothetical protein
MALEANVAKNPLYLSQKSGNPIPEPTLKRTARVLAKKVVTARMATRANVEKKPKTKW